MTKLQEVNNQYALVVKLLIENKTSGVTMVTAMKDYFHKFQTRLLEVEKAHPKLNIRRLPITAKNRFNHVCTYTNYKSLAPIPYLRNLFALLNKNGLK